MVAGVVAIYLIKKMFIAILIATKTLRESCAKFGKSLRNRYEIATKSLRNRYEIITFAQF